MCCQYHVHTREVNFYENQKKRAIRILLLVSGSLMLIYGIFRNEVTYVFNKAVKICLECIGIG